MLAQMFWFHKSLWANLAAEWPWANLVRLQVHFHAVLGGKSLSASAALIRSLANMGHAVVAQENLGRKSTK